MVTKNISLTEDAYNVLRAKKRRNESFSQVVKRIATKKGSVLEFAGAWKDLSEEDIKEIEKAREKAREYTRESMKKKLGIK